MECHDAGLQPISPRSSLPTESQRLLVALDNNGLEALEGGNTLNDRGNNVELLLGTLVVVTLALETDTDAAGRRTDTARPEGLVEAGRDADVLDTHGLLGELLDGLDRLGGLCERLARERFANQGGG